MKLPKIEYKLKHTVSLIDQGDYVQLRLEAVVPDVHSKWRRTTVIFERSCEKTFLTDPRFLELWVTGMIVAYETHEARHWIRIDGRRVGE